MDNCKSKSAVDIIKVGMLVVSAVVGAGFSSGKELAVYFARFGYAAYPCAVLCGLLFFGAVSAVARAAQDIQAESIEDYNRALFGSKLGTVADMLTLFNFLIVAAAMMAAVDSLMAFFGWGNPAVSLVTAALCFVVVLTGTKGLLNLNLILMPIVIIVLLVVGVGGALNMRHGGSYEHLTMPHKLIGNAISYISLNTLLASGLLVKVRIPYKTYVKGIALGSIIITLLMIGVIAGIISGGLTSINADMPVLVLAGSLNISALTGVIIWVGIFTSMAASVIAVTDWAAGFCKPKVVAAALVVIAAYIISRLGFSSIVEWVFPVSGVFGVVFVGASAWFCARRDKYLNIDNKSANNIVRA